MNCPHCGRDTERQPQLTPRETQVLDAMRSGIHPEDIPDQFGISSATVKQHIKRILRVNGFRHRGELFASFTTERHRLPDVLSPKQRAIGERIINGKLYQEIAADLKLSEDGVKKTAQQIFDLVGADDRYDLALRFTAASAQM